jgi:hypothetical protein
MAKTNIPMATEKQVSYALALMRKAGFGTDWMRSEHKALGATMRERSGRVVDWLASMDRQRISELIDDLKSRVG